MSSRDFLTNVDLVQNNDPSNPLSGYVRIIAKPDDRLYLRLNSGVEVELTNNSTSTSAPVENRYEVFDDEVVTVTIGRIMFQYGALVNRGFLINRGRIIEVAN